jgi:hypothetical protein
MAGNATQPQLLKTYSVIIMDLLPSTTRSGKVDQTLLNTYIKNTIQQVAFSYSGGLPDDVNVNAEIVKIVEGIIKTPSLYISIQATPADILNIYIKSIHRLLSYDLKRITDIERLITKAINDVSRDKLVEEAKNIMDDTFRVGGKHSIRTLIIDNIEKAARETIVSSSSGSKSTSSRSRSASSRSRSASSGSKSTSSRSRSASSEPKSASSGSKSASSGSKSASSGSKKEMTVTGKQAQELQKNPQTDEFIRMMHLMDGGRSKKRSTQHRRSYKRKTRKMNHRRKY